MEKKDMGKNLMMTVFAGLLAGFLCLPVIAQEKKESKKDTPEATEAKEEVPPGRTHYMGREVAMTMHWKGAGWLLRKTREREESAEEMLEELHLKPGMQVCDLGCGNGYHALRMAKEVAGVPEGAGPDAKPGQVIGVDVQPKMLEFLLERAAEEEVENIVPVLGEYHDPNLKTNSVDLILIVDAYHEFSHPELMLASMRAALTPKGAVVLVEFREEDKSVPIKPEHKMSKKQVNKELAANGFKLSREYDELPWQHMMWFQRDEEWKRPETK